MSITTSKRVTDIEQQLAHLRWRRVQNERLIRGAIDQTKSLQQKDTVIRLATNLGEEKAMWMTSVVKDEISKPLVISDEELHKIQESEDKVKKKLLRFSQRQLNTVKKLAVKVENRLAVENPQGMALENQMQKLAKLQILQKKIAQQNKFIDRSKPFLEVKNIPEKIFS